MATRYWVGSTGTWDASSTAHWSATSGGAAGASAPTAADDVILNSNSGTGTVTIADGALCKTLLAPAYTGSFNYGGALTVAGNTFTIGTSSTTTGTDGSVTFTSGAGSVTIRSNGKLLPALIFSAASSGIEFAFFSTINAKSITLTAGTINTNNNDVTLTNTGAPSFVCSGSGVKALVLDGTITTYSGFDLSGSNLTVTVSGMNDGFAVEPPDGSLTPTIISNGHNIGNLTLSPYGRINVTGALHCAVLTVAGVATPVGSVAFSGNVTADEFVSQGNSATNRVLITSLLGAASPITFTATKRTLSRTDFCGIAASVAWGPGATPLGNAGGNTNLTFGTAAPRYAVASGNWSNAAVWAASSGGLPGATPPLCHDNAVLDAVTGADAITLDMPRACKNLTCTGFTGSLTVAEPVLHEVSIFGDVVLDGTFTNAADTLTLKKHSGNKTLLTNGRNIGALTIDCEGETLSLSDALSCAALKLVSGTLTVGANNVTAASFESSGTRTRALNMGSGAWSLSGTGSVWNLSSSGLTFSKQTANIDLTDNSTTARTFAGASYSYNKLTIGGVSATSATTITGNNLFSELASTKTVAHSLLFADGSTQSIGKWSIAGSPGNLVTLDRVASGTFALTYTGSGEVSSNYLNVANCAASPSSTWYAGSGSTNGGNNSGLIFGALAAGNLFFGSFF